MIHEYFIAFIVITSLLLLCTSYEFISFACPKETEPKKRAPWQSSVNRIWQAPSGVVSKAHPCACNTQSPVRGDCPRWALTSYGPTKKGVGNNPLSERFCFYLPKLQLSTIATEKHKLSAMVCLPTPSVDPRLVGRIRGQSPRMGD